MKLLWPLQTGNEKQNTIRITFPEGMTLRGNCQPPGGKEGFARHRIYTAIWRPPIWREKYEFVEKIPKGEPLPPV